jgi:DedD protein
MIEDKKDNPNKQKIIRNRLVGLAALLLILAVIAPWIITDKSNSQTSTTPILQPNIVNEQFQAAEAAPDDNTANNGVNNVSSIPYIPDTDQNPSSLVSPEISGDEKDDLTFTTDTIEQDPKPYIIQLTALRNKQKIEELVALLRLNNYNVRVIPKNPEPNQLIKLLVGPYAKKEQAEQVIDNLNNLTKLKGIIVAN